MVSVETGGPQPSVDGKADTKSRNDAGAIAIIGEDEVFKISRKRFQNVVKRCGRKMRAWHNHVLTRCGSVLQASQGPTQGPQGLREMVIKLRKWLPNKEGYRTT